MVYLCSSLIIFYLYSLLIGYISSQTLIYGWYGYFLAGMLFSISMVRMILGQAHFNMSLITGLRAKTGATGLIYRKVIMIAFINRRDHHTLEDQWFVVSRDSCNPFVFLVLLRKNGVRYIYKTTRLC